MDALKLHLLINYYPAIGIVIATAVLAAGLWLRNVRAKRFALKVIFVMAILTVGVVFSGEFASWSEEPQAGPRADALETHKITATLAFAAVLGAGVSALVGLIRGRVDAERPKTAYVFVLIFAVVASALLIATILKGRQVKWAAMGVPAVYKSIETENRLWHV